MIIQLILQSVSILFFMAAVVAFLFQIQYKSKKTGFTIYSLLTLVLILTYYWGMGVLYQVDRHDFYLLIYTFIRFIAVYIAEYKNLKFNSLSRISILILTEFLIFKAGGYDTIITYFNLF